MRLQRLRLVFVLALICGPVMAQQKLGTITGTVKDSSGAVIPEVTVKALNAATNLIVQGLTQWAVPGSCS